MSGSTRDATAARAKAAEHVERAQQVAAAVNEFHQAADEIERGQSLIAAAAAQRALALRSMRDAGLSIAEIAAFTGLSSSRVQALLRGDSPVTPEDSPPVD